MSEATELQQDDQAEEPQAGNFEREDLLAQVEALRAENDRLRAAYRDAQRQRYRRTAGGFGAIGVLALIGAALLPGVRTILLALGGTGVFAAVMTLYLTPESFVPASIGEAVSQTYSENAAAMAADLGLSETRLYLPTADDVRLYLPQHSDYDIPDSEALSTPFVTTDNDRSRGLSLAPSGLSLYESFEQAHSGPVPEAPAALARALSDAAVEQFELVDTADPDVETGRVALGVSGSRISPLSALDHPLTSLVAVGLATQLGHPVEVAVEEPNDDRYDALLIYSWEASEDSVND